MTVTGHGYQITFLGIRSFQDFGRRVPERQMSGDREIIGTQGFCGFFQIGPVIFHLLGLCKFELVEIPGSPAIRNMQKQERRTEVLSQFRDVRKNGLISRAVFEGDEDFLIHGGWFSISRLVSFAEDNTPSFLE